MKKLLAIFLLISVSAQAQDTLDADSSESVNERIIDYVHDNMGKKIGQGVCSELITGIENYLRRQGIKADSMYEIYPEYVEPGDIILMDTIVCSGGDSIINHVGIVYTILSNNQIAYANQNVGTIANNREKVFIKGREVDVEKDSHIITSIIHPPSIISGKLKFYRF